MSSADRFVFSGPPDQLRPTVRLPRGRAHPAGTPRASCQAILERTNSGAARDLARVAIARMAHESATALIISLSTGAKQSRFSQCPFQNLE